MAWSARVFIANTSTAWWMAWWNITAPRGSEFRGVHASRVLVSVSRRNSFSSAPTSAVAAKSKCATARHRRQRARRARYPRMRNHSERRFSCPGSAENKREPLEQFHRRFDICDRHIIDEAGATDCGNDHKPHFAARKFLVEPNRRRDFFSRKI